MGKITVTIIDSGISKTFEKEKNIISRIGFEKKCDGIEQNDNYIDENGHGSFCYQAILRRNNNVDFRIVKILDQNKKASIEALIEALKYALCINTDLICLAASISDSVYTETINMFFEQLCKQNKIVLCARGYEQDRLFPANSHNAIGVESEAFRNEDNFYYNSKLTIPVKSFGLRMPLMNLAGAPVWVGGNSIACANFTGSVCDLFEKYGDVGNINYLRKILRQEMMLRDYNQSDFFNFEHLDEEDYKIDEICMGIVNSYVKVFDVEDYTTLFKFPLFSNKNALTFSKLSNLFAELNQYFSICINQYEMSCKDIISIYSLAEYIRKQLGAEENAEKR